MPDNLGMMRRDSRREADDGFGAWGGSLTPETPKSRGDVRVISEPSVDIKVAGVYLLDT